MHRFEKLESTRIKLRKRDLLPEVIPQGGSITCRRCVNTCALENGEVGYCGIREAQDGTIIGGDNEAVLSWYFDALPTNCVSSHVCSGAKESGFNLAVFCHGCTFDCLFCQNYSHRKPSGRNVRISVEELLDAVAPEVRCVCFFGGDPTPQLGVIAKFAENLRKNRPDVRICFETNGAATSVNFETMLDLAHETGGTVKVDVKAFDKTLHRALTGVTNVRTLKNVARGIEKARQRPQVPLLVTSTLLVPGYVTKEEVSEIAHYIAELNPKTPYVLLAFHPTFAMNDLQRTRRTEAEAAERAAKDAGLTNIRIANRHLLW